MQRSGIAIVVAVAAAFWCGVPTSAHAQSRMPSNPYARLFRGQISPDLKAPRTLEQPAQEPKEALTISPMFQVAPVCMPTIHGDASVDPTIRHEPPANGPMPLIRVIPVPPCRKSVR